MSQLAIGSGIGASLGFATESTVGTAATPDHWAEFNSESLAYNKSTVQGMGLHAGGQVNRGARRKLARKGVAGSFELDLAYQKLGPLFKNVMGSGSTSTPTLISGAAYKQVHVLGDQGGQSLTFQVGRPQTDGTVVPFTYNGCKLTHMVLSVTDNAEATVTFDVDGWNVTTATALTSPAYVTSNNQFSFADANVFTLGGTVTTATGVSSVSGAASVASVVKGFTLDITRAVATERYGLGNAGIKREQITNGFTAITGTLDTEFTSRAELYDVFANDSSTALHLTLTGAPITGGGGNSTFDVLLPMLFFDTGAPAVGGPDLVGQSVGFTVLDDSVNNPVQISITSADSAL